MDPAISLIITAYNRENLVSAAVGSVLRQTRTDFELVVWDDGSTDGTADAVRRIAGDDPRVRLVTSRNMGQAKAINSAARLLKGKYFGWIDSDDALAPSAIEETAAVLEANPDIGMVYTDYLAINEAGRVLGKGKRTEVPYSKNRLLIDFMTFHFRLIRRDLFDSVGMMDESLPAASDYDLCLRLSEVTQFQHLPRPMYFYRLHKKTISSMRRMDQIVESRAAIARALKRRGMDAEFDIEVEIVGKYRLVAKNADSKGSLE